MKDLLLQFPLELEWIGSAVGLLRGKSKSSFHKSLKHFLSKKWVQEKMVSLSDRKSVGLLRSFSRWMLALSLMKSFQKVRNRIQLFSRLFVWLDKKRLQNGDAFVVSYLKVAHTCLARALARSPASSMMEIDDKFIFPRLRRNGLPVLIPSRDASAIMRGRPGVIRMWMTFFALYRVLKCPPKVKLETITSPFTGDVERMNDVITGIAVLVSGNLKRTARYLDRGLFISPRTPVGLLPIVSWETASSTQGAVAWKGLLSSIWSIKQDPKIYSLMIQWLDLVKATDFKALFVRTAEKLEKSTQFLTYKGSVDRLQVSRYALGQFAFKLEPAGKVRVFAIVDIVTQWIMNPFHKELFTILKQIPTDGTFDQLGALERVKDMALKTKYISARDLSAATDRLPISIQQKIVGLIFGSEDLAQVWANLLVGRGYYIPDTSLSNKLFPKELIGSPLFYAVGQPMGARSSWAMLALTHHYLVQLAAHRAKKIVPGEWFSGYAIVGDDIVITDEQVDQEYLDILSSIGMEVAVAKCVVDSSGDTIDFIKKTIYRGIDVSGLSWRELLSSNNFVSRVAIADRLTKCKVGPLGVVVNILASTWRDLNPSLAVKKAYYWAWAAMRLDPKDLLLGLYDYQGAKVKLLKGISGFFTNLPMMPILSNLAKGDKSPFKGIEREVSWDVLYAQISMVLSYKFYQTALKAFDRTSWIKARLAFEQALLPDYFVEVNDETQEETRLIWNPIPNHENGGVWEIPGGGVPKNVVRRSVRTYGPEASALEEQIIPIIHDWFDLLIRRDFIDRITKVMKILELRKPKKAFSTVGINSFYVPVGVATQFTLDEWLQLTELFQGIVTLRDQISLVQEMPKVEYFRNPLETFRFLWDKGTLPKAMARKPKFKYDTWDNQRFLDLEDMMDVLLRW